MYVCMYVSLCIWNSSLPSIGYRLSPRFVMRSSLNFGMNCHSNIQLPMFRRFIFLVNFSYTHSRSYILLVENSEKHLYINAYIHTYIRSTYTNTPRLWTFTTQLWKGLFKHTYIHTYMHQIKQLCITYIAAYEPKANLPQIEVQLGFGIVNPIVNRLKQIFIHVLHLLQLDGSIRALEKGSHRFVIRAFNLYDKWLEL